MAVNFKDTFLDTLNTMKANHEYNITTLNEVADKIEEDIGSAECWNTVRHGFSADELMENLIYIAKENDL